MKRFLLTAVIMLALGNNPAFGADVGVSISIGQPGFYGRIDIGDAPPPMLVYPQPVVIQPVPVGRAVQPIYLRVPYKHRKNWSKHCGKYNACGQPVYFVKDRWYRDVYVPHYRKHGHRRDDDRGRRYDRDRQRGHGRD